MRKEVQYFQTDQMYKILEPTLFQVLEFTFSYFLFLELSKK